ncbi:hypothetical protein FB451DRAFT_1467407 [Mycena latifolia]|nr:hypothetical protein FB451DRAFT_1467407 [Mycena latifolia]
MSGNGTLNATVTHTLQISDWFRGCVLWPESAISPCCAKVNSTAMTVNGTFGCPYTSVFGATNASTAPLDKCCLDGVEGLRGGGRALRALKPFYAAGSAVCGPRGSSRATPFFLPLSFYWFLSVAAHPSLRAASMTKMRAGGGGTERRIDPYGLVIRGIARLVVVIVVILRVVAHGTCGARRSRRRRRRKSREQTQLLHAAHAHDGGPPTDCGADGHSASALPVGLATEMPEVQQS